MPPKIDFRKRQKGALVETSQPRPIRISAPGHILGKGPGQGRMEGEPTDEVQQYRQDMANAPPRLRVELTPPPPSSSDRGRGTFRGGRGRGARGVRGGMAGRGRGGALGGGMPGPSRPAVPPTGPAAMRAGQPAVQASAGPAFLNLGNSAGNSRMGAPSAGSSSHAGGRASQPASHPDRKPIIQSAQRQNAATQSMPSKKLPDRPLANTPPANPTTYFPAPPEAPDTVPSRPYQPMGAYAKVMQNRIDRSLAPPDTELVRQTAEAMEVEPVAQSESSTSAGKRTEAFSPYANGSVTLASGGKRPERPTPLGTRVETPASSETRPVASTTAERRLATPAPAKTQPTASTSQPGTSASATTTGSTTARPKSKLKFKPNLSKPAMKPPTTTDRPAPAFITRGRDAYSPSEPVVPLPSESSSSGSSDEEPLAAADHARSPTTPVEPAPDLDVEVLRSTRRIVDYTAQVKTEPGTAAMMASSIDEPEEEAVEDADDSEKQSSTLLILKSQRPDLADCWSRDVKVRIEARKAARIAVEKELENKSRRITSSMWRDDGYAVDWALINQGIVTYSYARELRPFEQPEHLRESVIAKRTAWEEEQLKQWDATYPDRTRGNIKRTSFKFSFEWHRRSATLDSTVLTGGPPTASSGQSSNPAKRVRSPSPETGRKSLKYSIDQAARTTCAPTPEIGLTEQPSTSYTAIEILYVEDQRAKSRVPVVYPRQYALGISARAAKADVKEWSQRCLPKITGKQAWHPADNNKAPENVRNAVRSFIQKLFQLDPIREIHSLRTMYHPNCTISVLVQDVKGTSSIGRHCREGPGEFDDWYRIACTPPFYIWQQQVRSDAGKLLLLCTCCSTCTSGKQNVGSVKSQKVFNFRRTWILLFDRDIPGLMIILADYMLLRPLNEPQDDTPSKTIDRHAPPARMTQAGAADSRSDAADDSSGHLSERSLALESAESAELSDSDTSTSSERIRTARKGKRSVRQAIVMSSDESEEEEDQEEAQSGGDVSEEDELDQDQFQEQDVPTEREDPGVNIRNIEARLEATLQSQATWQSIKAMTQNKSGPIAKLTEIESEIVALHTQLVELRKQPYLEAPNNRQAAGPVHTNIASSSRKDIVQPAPEAMVVSMPARNPSKAEDITDLQLHGGQAQAIHRTPGDKSRFMIKGFASALQGQTNNLATFSMRATVQFFGSLASTATTTLENGLRVIDGCMPVNGRVIMAIERNATVSNTSSQQILCMASDPHRRPTYHYMDKHPHAGNPFCVTPIGSHGEGDRYMFASGGSDHKVVLWTVPVAGQQTLTSSVRVLHRQHTSVVRSVAYEQERKWLLSGSTGGDLLVYDCNSSAQKLLKTARYSVGASIWHIHTNELAPSSIAVEAEQTRDQVYVFDMRKQKPIKRFGFDINLIERKAVGQTRFEKGSYNGDYFARGYADGTVRMWDMRMLQRNKQPYMVAKASNDAIRHVMVDEGKLRILTAGTLTTYDLHRGM